MPYPLTFLYPSAVEEANSISYAAQCAKIARHSPCSSCSCQGLHPPPEWRAMPDDSEDVGEVLDIVEGSEVLTDEGHLRFCNCGHSYEDHGCDAALDREEHSRRARAAVRIDEILEDKGRLFDFEYVDDDVLSLRRQMQLPPENNSFMDISMEYEDPTRSVEDNGSDRASSSGLSDVPMSITGNKRPRSMSSSLSDDDMEDDKPLASRPAPSLSSTYGRMGSQGNMSMDVDLDGDGDADAEGDIDADADAEAEDDPDNISTTAFHDPQRSGKSNTTLGHVSLANQTPHGSNGHVNSAMAAAEAKAKANVIRTVGNADEGQQVARLATGVAIDAGVASSEAPVRRERPAVLEEQAGIIKFEVVSNDGSPRSSILLTGLKSLFQKQLPKMPREYITRLVFDRNAQAMAVVQRGHKVVGGITYRPFPHRSFAEIVFFAIASVYQVNGYGGHLMNHFKAHVRKNIPSIMHFLAYADNYAIGYFKKQGFTRDITLPRELWVGYIKDYEGGTIMQCTMLPNVDYLRARETLLEQKEAIMGKIRQLSRSHVVHTGLSVFKNAPPGYKIDPKDVPGLRESGWTPDMDALLGRPTRSADHMAMKKLLNELQGHADAWPFLLPVNKAEVTDYYDVIKNPMDFSTMERKLESDAYLDFDSFVNDAQLVFSNCRTYNPENSAYSKRAVRLEKFLKDYLAKAQKV